VLGAAITPIVEPIAHYGLALAAGVTLYVAASNLVPETQHERGWLVQGGVFAGVVAFFLVTPAAGALMDDLDLFGGKASDDAGA
jgi:zinc and cadmium transporter